MTFLGHSFSGLDLGLNFEKAEDAAWSLGEYVDPSIDEYELRSAIDIDRKAAGLKTTGFVDGQPV